MNTVALFVAVAALAIPASARPQFGGFNLNDPSHLIAGAGGLAAGAFAFKNIAEGNDNIRARPTFGLAFNPHTNQVVPQVGAAVQVGEGDLAPTFNVGGQFDGQNINPFVGAGASIDGQGGAGGLGGNVNTGVVFDGRGPNGANPTFGANAAVGNFNLGSLNGGRGFNFGRR